MKRKNIIFAVFILLFILTLFYAPQNSYEGQAAPKAPVVSNQTGENAANLLKADDGIAVRSGVDNAGGEEEIEAVVQTSAPLPDSTPDTATIIFTFDDGYISDYELAYPILKRYGIRGTSYIIPKYQDEGKPNALTWDMVKEMKEYGWVFGCHTYAHSDLTKMTADEIKESMLKVNRAFLAQGLEPPAIHAFPYGLYDQKAIDAIKPYRIQMRKAFYERKFVDPNKADPYEIDCCSMDMRTEKRLKEHEALVDKAVEQKAIIVFRCHCLYKESPDDMGEWPVQTDSRLFKKLVEYCVNKGCRFMTMTDLARLCSGSESPKS